MSLMRSAIPIATATALLCMSGCAKTLPDEAPFTVSSASATATGHYAPVAIDSVERMTIDAGRLVLHGADQTATFDLPPTADPDEKNRGWALVTEGEGEGSRTLTFTQETSLEEFTITVPEADGQVIYGSLGGRDGRDVVLFAYGSGGKAYWGWALVEKKKADAS
jgi:hypothetical protein